jgi:distribution and morphology protein 31
MGMIDAVHFHSGCPSNGNHSRDKGFPEGPRMNEHHDKKKPFPQKHPNVNDMSEKPHDMLAGFHSASNVQDIPQNPHSPAEQSQKPRDAEETSRPPPPPPPNYDNYPKSLRRLAMSLPHLHRPTRDDFLKVASGFWQRARIRFKWFTIKSFRKFNADDISAFVTWFLTAQFLWIFIGT